MFALLLWACAANVDTDRTSACISRFPPSDPFDVGRGPVVEESGGTRAVDLIAAECHADAGNVCDVDDFISKGAAECIASKAGLERGIGSWIYFMHYDPQRRQVIWEVTNQLRVDDQQMVFGRKSIIDAVHGEVLEMQSYEAIQDFLRPFK